MHLSDHLQVNFYVQFSVKIDFTICCSKSCNSRKIILLERRGTGVCLKIISWNLSIFIEGVILKQGLVNKQTKFANSFDELDAQVK